MPKVIKKRIIIAFKLGSLGILLCAIVLGGYVYVSIHELGLKLDQLKFVKSKSLHSTSIIEKGSFVSKNELSAFLQFTRFEDEDFLKTAFVEKEKIKLFALEAVELPPLIKNSCERYRCVQLRSEFEKIPAPIWKSLLGTEDFRFLEHRGVDLIAIARAIVTDIIAMKFVQGGSTLTQQLVKNLFLTSEKTLVRKFKELIYALYIENVLEKEQIVSLYLNEVFWGSFQGVYLKGFYAASLAYFNKVPSKLEDFESVILVSLLKGPYFYHPKNRLERLKGRSRAVLKRLQNLSLIPDSIKAWTDEKWDLWQKDYIERSLEREFRSYYLLSQNRDSELEGFEKFILLSGVSKVRSLLKERIKGADIGVKILIYDKSCKSFDCEKSFSFYNKTQRDKREAMTKEAHQVGSLLKPIVYESFMGFGKTYQDMVSTAPITLRLKSGPWTPKDYSKAKASEITLKEALQKSKNIPLIRIASEIGFEKIEKEILEYIPNLKKPLDEYPSQLLGAIEIPMSKTLEAYSKFIETKCQEIKEGALPFENSVLYHMSQANKTTISKLAKGSLRDAHIFGKTGTSNNGLDNWYFAFDGENFYLVWFGVETNRAESSLRLSGGASAFRIFQNFINNRGKLPSEVHCE